MSKLAIIHISDIHIKSNTDSCLKHAQDIATASYKLARDADACLLLITGDLAYSGAKKEYQVINTKLIQPIVESVEQETKRPLYISITPGNHDCLLKPINDVREDVIKSIIEEPSKAENEQRIEVCVSAQKYFFEFLNQVITPKAITPSKLFWQQEFEVGGKCVVVSSLNVAWMSRLPEAQGQLVYPINLFNEFLSKSACIHLALIHHPFNWYEQSAYQELRTRLRRSCTAVFSGHEHVGNSGKIEEKLSGSSLFFESAALQPHEKNAEAGFSTHLFDLENRQVTTQAFVFSSMSVKTKGDVTLSSWSDDNLIHSALDITPDFTSHLNDSGGNFTHAAKEKLYLEDLFVWPDLRIWKLTDIAKSQIRSSKILLSNLENCDQIIIYGDDKSGKTTLLLWYFRELVSQGFAPVYLSVSDIKVKSPEDAENRIEKAVSEQYKNPENLKTLSKDRRILLIDDVDRIKSGIDSLIHLLSYSDRHFSGICLTAANGFEITNLVSGSVAGVLSTFTSFELMRFGLKLRHQLIKKWCSLSSNTNKIELDRRIDDVESIVNSVIGKRLVPEYPIYLLILLQSSEQHRHGEIQNSGLSHYYQYLITKNLGEVGVKPSELDEHFNYLSLLAWHFREENCKELEVHELAKPNKKFSERFVTVDLNQRLDLLTKARILTKRDNSYSFSYPYVYYFFTGLYLAKNIEEPIIKAWIEDSCQKLYLHDRAHAVLFLTHHVENKWVIQLICQVLQDCFSEKKPIELNTEDTAFLNKLAGQPTQLKLAHPNVESNQSSSREYRDNVIDQEPEDEQNEYDLLSFASKWNLLLKTAEILGLILKNYYGSLERPQKQEMIRQVFDGPLRALRIWIDEISENIDIFLDEISRRESQSKKIPAHEIDKIVKRAIFNLMVWVTTNVIASSGSFVASDKLREDIFTVVIDNPTNAYRLIEAASRLLKPGPIPIDKLKKFAHELDSNPYAFGVLQTLGIFHMYMFHTEEPQRQALSEALKISFEKTKSIEIKKSGRLLK